MALSAIACPAERGLTIVRGDSFLRSFILSQGGAAIDLTGYTAKAQIRDRPDGTVLADFTATVKSPATAGTIEIKLTTTQTAVLPAEAQWDFQVTLTADPTNNTHTLLRGSVTVLPDITQ